MNLGYGEKNIFVCIKGEAIASMIDESQQLYI